MEKSLAKEKEKALAKEKEKALVKEKERKQKVVANEIQQTHESFQPRSLLLNDVSVKEEEIGRGATAVVSRVTWHGTECAAKSIHSSLVDGTTNGAEYNYVKERFLEECCICARLSHPNIVHFYGVFYPLGATLPLLVMELMDTSLTKCIEKYADIPLYIKLSFLHDVSLGIRYLHSFQPPIVHRDLSSNNVLITKACVAKVGDLGVAKIVCVNNKLTRAPGTLDFMPPEALLTEPIYDTPLDVFSYGGITIHCMSGEWPSPERAVDIDPTTRRVVGYSEQEHRRGLIEKMGNVGQLKSLTIRCLDNLPEARPTMVEISEQVGLLKNQAMTSSPIAGMNMIDKDIALAKSMAQSEKDVKIVTAVSHLSSNGSEEPRPLSPHLRVRTMSLKTASRPLTWRSCDAMPQGMRSPKAVEHNGNIYVGGGDTGQDQVDASLRVFVYNIAKGKWSSLPPTPQRWFAMVIMEGKLLVVGGATCKNVVTGQITSLDEAKRIWYAEYAPLPTSRSDPAAIGYLNHLIVIGGFDGRQSMDVVEILDVLTNQWSRAASLPYTITSVTPILHGDVLYLAGGIGITGGKQSPKKSFTSTSVPLLLKSVLAGNVSSIWKELCPVPFSYSVTGIHDNCLFTLCGRDSNSKQDSSAVHCYDATRNTWSQVGELPTCRRMCAALSAATDGKFYVLGGSVGKVKYSDIVECSI